MADQRFPKIHADSDETNKVGIANASIRCKKQPNFLNLGLFGMPQHQPRVTSTSRHSVLGNRLEQKRCDIGGIVQKVLSPKLIALRF